MMISRHFIYPAHSRHHRSCFIGGRIPPSSFARIGHGHSHNGPSSGGRAAGSSSRRRQYTAALSSSAWHNHLVSSRRRLATSCYGNDESTMDDHNDDEGMNDASTATAYYKPSSTSSETSWEQQPTNNNNYSLLGSRLLDKTISRAMRTLSTTSINEEDGTSSSSSSSDSSRRADYDDTSVNDYLKDAAVIRSRAIIDQSIVVGMGDNNSQSTPTSNTNNYSTPGASSERGVVAHQDKRTYLGNPSVTLTALAHSLWQSTILPYQDTVIDATCGNGKDCLALARMLFPNSIGDNDDNHQIDSNVEHDEKTTIPSNTHKPKQPRLIGIDIQPRAIANTQRSFLSSSLSSDIYYKFVTLLEQSHEHLLDVLPREEDRRSVGLVCYNLGFLPGAPPATAITSSTTVLASNNNNYKECQTQTETTLHSITDATLLLRVGGLLSIMTYPGSNLEESIAVEHFVEGLAMLTTREVGGWRGYVESIPDYVDENNSDDDDDDDDDDDKKYDKERVRCMVARALERVVAGGAKNQTWRAFVHKPLGRRLSPVLITAMRIK
ncbi:hypothetical protein ACHAWU_007116 [Discostella pseudostelligera]|uniref:Uncharacterized protein n=1 Tax=Discostella pseudostelligera TaxID=259834 RepID=A0ABD3M6H4_9STRA